MGLFDFLFGKKKQDTPATQPKQNTQPKSTSAPSPKPQPKPAAPKPAAKSTFTAETFLKHLEALANKYYKERGVVSLEDWMVTQKIGNDFKFYITQYPDEEFNDPNCEVTLMVEFMDHNGRMEVVNKFFPSQQQKPAAPKPLTPEKPHFPNGQYYTLDQLRQIDMGGYRLQPIDAGLVFDETQQNVVALFAEKSPRIKKYLPNLDLSSPEAIAKYFTTLCMKTEMGMEFGYSIKMQKHGDIGYVGLIFVHTPKLNEASINFPKWTIDFCMFEPMEGKSIMFASIIHILNLLKQSMKVEDVYAIVDEDNVRCLNLMDRLPFELQPEVLTDPSTGKKAKLFCCHVDDYTFKEPKFTQKS